MVIIVVLIFITQLDTVYPDLIVDQVKGAWFALHKGFFKASGKRQVDCYPLSNEGVPSGKLTSMYLDVYSSGKKTVENKFEQKVYETLSDLCYSILTSDNQVIEIETMIRLPIFKLYSYTTI